MRRTLALVTAAVTSMVAISFVVPLALAVRQVAHDRALRDAERQATALAPVLEIASSKEAIERAINALPAGRDGRMAVHRAGDTAIGHARARPEDIRFVLDQLQPMSMDSAYGRLVLQPVEVAGGNAAVVEVAVPASETTRGVAAAWALMVLTAAGLVGASIFVADRLAARTVHAASGLAEAASRLGGGDLEIRVTPSGPTELVAAGQAFNTMADRVVKLMAAERELVADLSHRLRTPLTALRLDAEAVGVSPAAQRVRHAAQQLEREIDAIIRAARSPLGSGTGGACDAAEIVRARMRFWSALAADQRRQCQVVGAETTVWVPLSRADLIAIIDSLVGNVFRYTPVGCAFSVELRPMDGDTALIVEDGGPGIVDPESAVRRGASGAGSTGLGLDIARRAAEATGGTLRIGRSALGGARVMLRFGSLEPTSAGVPRRRLRPPIRQRPQSRRAR
ncbi:MAG: HAMP domain-containing histidine kinase [Actinobacteria bacterium]|nr:HAMP domain-containing histidine kinase [Actinomycetota bacterium]MBI3687599.1 HAMP domain-containing histidine kinase [Actinomycetota bacterium]